MSVREDIFASHPQGRKRFADSYVSSVIPSMTLASTFQPMSGNEGVKLYNAHSRPKVHVKGKVRGSRERIPGAFKTERVQSVATDVSE